MKILYFFSKNSEFKEVEVNLDPTYKIKYDEEKSVLYIKKLNYMGNEVDKVLGNESNIKSIVALIGRNGGGKTSIIRELSKMFVQHPEHEYLCVYQTNEGIFWTNTIKKDIHEHKKKNITSTIRQTIKVELSIDNNVICNNSDYFSISDFKKDLNDINYIYFSNIFDNTWMFRSVGFKNISTNYMVSQNRDIKVYEHEVIKQYVKLANDCSNRNDSFIQEIEKLKFGYDIKYNVKTLRTITENEDLNIMLGMLSQVNYDMTEVDFNKRRTYSFLSQHCTEIISDYPEEALKVCCEISIEKGIETNFRTFYDYFRGITETKFRVEGITQIKNFLQSEAVTKDGFIAHSKVLDFLNIIQDCEKSVRETIEINIPTLSSGEVALLNMYARFNDIKEDINSESVTIIIDECDVYMHPENQRNFVTRLQDMCNIFFPQKEISVILTSHSPFILSDIPSRNVYRVKCKDDKIQCLEFDVETFGQNLHTIVKNNFFLESTMGERSKKVITRIAEKLKKGKLQPGEQLVIEKSIELVGEPVLKKHLMLLYKEYRENVSTKEELIEYHKKELMKLEKDDNNSEL